MINNETDRDLREVVEAVMLVEVGAVDTVVFQPLREARLVAIRLTVQLHTISLHDASVPEFAHDLWRPAQAS